MVSTHVTCNVTQCTHKRCVRSHVTCVLTQNLPAARFTHHCNHNHNHRLAPHAHVLMHECTLWLRPPIVPAGARDRTSRVDPKVYLHVYARVRNGNTDLFLTVLQPSGKHNSAWLCRWRYKQARIRHSETMSCTHAQGRRYLLGQCTQ